jgi:hypothetical protein
MGACGRFAVRPGVNSMMAVLLLAGFGLLLGGLLTVAFGIQLELSFGNTLLLAGAIVSCTGVMMLGLWLAVRELKNVVRQLERLPAADAGKDSFGDTDAPSDQWVPENGGGPSSQDPLISRPATSAQQRQERQLRDRGPGEPLMSRPVEAPPTAKPRRNLLFSSSTRRDRERTQARADEPSPTDPLAAPSAGSGERPSAGFEGAWPRSERARAGEESVPRRSGRSTAARDEDQPQVTVLKSGVVDGMAYSLYSDGSIEAQMPEGMMRFASIDELRAHLDQRS